MVRTARYAVCRRVQQRNAQCVRTFSRIRELGQDIAAR
jgi:hypothetical protein